VLFSLSTLAFGVGKTYAQAAVTQAPNIVRPEVDIAFNQLLNAPLVKQAFQALEADHARAVQDMRDLTEIEAPHLVKGRRLKNFLPA
jgi:tripeptide aminopeptidase